MGKRVTWAIFLAGAGALAAAPYLARLHAGAAVAERLAAVDGAGAGHCELPVALGRAGEGDALASWQTIGGCGAGASAGTGGGVKWIGRNVRGGLFNVECQANYIEMPYGYNFVGTTLIRKDIFSSTTLGVSVPYLYKYMRDPYGLEIDLANKGPGDITLMGTQKFGSINDWALTLAVGLPTGSHDVKFRGDRLWQDRQLGLGKPTGSLTLDHTMDELWGAVVVGGNVNWRGGEGHDGAYRAPTGSLYAYVNYLLGPFAPAIGLMGTGYRDDDRDRYQPQDLPRATLTGHLSLEFAIDEVALLIGATLPLDFQVTADRDEVPRNRWGPWTAAIGLAFAPF